MKRQQTPPVEASNIRLFFAAMPPKEMTIDRCSAKTEAAVSAYRILRSSRASQSRFPLLFAA